jgi:LysM repeat protein
MAMMDRQELLKRAIDWEKSHAPNTGYTEKAFRAVCEANLPNGDNLLREAMAQFTGREEPGVDLVRWDSDGDGKPDAEDRLDYSNDYRYSLDRSGDCSSTMFVFYQIFFRKNIGTTTLKMWEKYHKTSMVPWEHRRLGDIVGWNFKDGRPISHEGCVIVEPDKHGRGGQIAHTTSPGDPFRFQEDSYAASNRIGVFRVLTDAEYQSLWVTDHKDDQQPPIIIQPEEGIEVYIVKPGDCLLAIAKAFKTTVPQLMAWNPRIKNPGLILPGWELQVKAPSIYKVKPGDNLTRIANKFGTTTGKLLKLNPSLQKNPNFILPGWEIKLR